jgi:hypothetical protein
MLRQFLQISHGSVFGVNLPLQLYILKDETLDLSGHPCELHIFRVRGCGEVTADHDQDVIEGAVEVVYVFQQLSPRVCW